MRAASGARQINIGGRLIKYPVTLALKHRFQRSAIDFAVKFITIDDRFLLRRQRNRLTIP
ncbi:hypothetical protein WS95_17865 [Burkholderia sp. MSMB1826]|nr:hypothetical protein WS95_17865 [Burkholderia sp. MSMB1826]KWE49052.1 hypothetical protein WT53_04785 [Burkholderia sp. MSMB2157WGS]